MSSSTSWNPQTYSQNARFVSDLGEPLLQLLDPRANERILDLGCGDGALTEKIAAHGSLVIGVDASAAQVLAAQQRGLLVAVMDGQQLSFKPRFDAVFTNAALHWMREPAKVIEGVANCLKPGGRFVFSIPHPCFNTNGSTLLAERDDYAGTGKVTFGVRVNRYLSLTPERGLAAASQPSPHYYFHRPLSSLLRSCFAAGFFLDGLEEPAFESNADERRALSWDQCTDIPPVLVGRLRVGTASTTSEKN